MTAAVRQIPFLKVSGAGNDFILIDNINRSLDIDWVSFARASCSRPFGVGGDGLLVIEPSPKVDFRMSYFNADGSSGGMCGNGGRCVARYAHEKGISKKQLKFEALDYVYEAFVHDNDVTLRMKDARVSDRKLRFHDRTGNSVEGWPVDSGSPHIVILHDNLEDVDVSRWGKIIRHDAALEPLGTNVNFYTPQGNGRIGLRTYERGVEGETQACGTGAVAAAVVSAVDLGTVSPIAVGVRSGETVTVDFVPAGKMYTNVTLRGSAHLLFTGLVFFDEASGKLTDVRVTNHGTSQ